MAAVLDGVPYSTASKIPKMKDGSQPKLLFDISKEWAGFDSYAATEYIFKNHVNETTGLAKMDPGFERKLVDPKVTGTADVGLGDYIV